MPTSNLNVAVLSTSIFVVFSAAKSTIANDYLSQVTELKTTSILADGQDGKYKKNEKNGFRW